MNLENNISVIIPVFNAASFVTKAAESALGQPETSEVILIEDGSSDNSLEVCKNLVEKYEKVKLYRHPGNINKGAGLSRNLGIEKSKSDFIAFLDADDYFLPDRFRAERSIFKNDATVDGVYGAMGFHYYSVDGEKKYKQKGYPEITTISEKIPSRELCFLLMGIHARVRGQIHLNTLTVKREVFYGRTPVFNSLMMHEDTAFLVQLSINCSLEAGVINEPIAMYGVHDQNRIINNPKNSGSHVKYWKSLYNWASTDKNGQPYEKLFQALLMKEEILISGKFLGLFKLCWFSLTNKLFLSKAIFFRPACLHVLNRKLVWYCINFKEQIQHRLYHSDTNSLILDDFFYKS
ncbi:MAG: glycosyltransferase family 2 protein [Bacteroidota bacterium]|nr:glycosyltransferase family 2 protein [Bacteroidota bacterium]